MYKNFNNSSDYNIHSYEYFQDKKQVKTKFGKDKKAYADNQKQMNNINKKDVNIKKVKIDKDTSMKKPNSYTPKKIKQYGSYIGIFIAALLVYKFIATIIEYKIAMPILLLFVAIGVGLVTKIGKKKVLKMLKFTKKIGKKVVSVKTE